MTRLIATALLTGTMLTAGIAAARPVPHHAAATSDAKAFAALSDRFIKSIAEESPVNGTQLGDHRFDDKLPDISPAGHARMVAHLKAFLADLGKINRTALTREAQVDAAMLDNELRYQLWQAETLQDWQWDIQSYNETAGNALYLLAARDFAPWPQRLKAATARMEALPAFLAQTRAVIVPARVPNIYATTVAQRNAGIIQIAETMLAPHKGELAPADQQRFDAALAGLKTAVAEHQKWLDTVLVPQAKGDFRLGAQRYDEKIRFALGGTLNRAEIKARALSEVTHVRAQMYALARQVLTGKPGAPALPDQPTADEQQHAIEAALALTYQQRPARAELMNAAKSALAQATDFVRAKNLVTMPDAPVRVIEMPKFQQGFAVAYDDPPGPLEKGQANFFAVAAVPDEWTDAQATSFLSEYNNFMVQDLAIHEAMPGHYLQLWHANKNPSVLRAVLSSGPFVEGWAVYAEGMMADQGYMNGDPLFKLTVLKMRLRSVTNSLLDIGIQAEGMTRDQAMELMMKTAFQQEREAAGKWVRASLSSAQLLSYFSGYAEHMALREEAMRRWGTKFNLHDYNDAVLAHGLPPARYVRELMFGLPIG